LPGVKGIDFTGVGIVFCYYAYFFNLKTIRTKVLTIFFQIKAMQDCQRILKKNKNPYVSAKDFQQKKYSIRIRRFFRSMLPGRKKLDD